MRACFNTIILAIAAVIALCGTESNADEKRLLAALDAGPADEAARAAILNNLGSIYHSAGRYFQAENSYRRAIEILRRCCQAQPELARATGNLATLYVETGQLAKAERLDVEAAAHRVADGPDAARLFLAAGALKRSRGRYADAERYQRQALAIWQRLAPSGLETLQTHSEIGLTCLEAGRDRDALASFQDALRIAEQSLPPSHPGVVHLLANIGVYYFYVRDYGQAERFSNRALSAAEQSMGPEHPLVAQILSNYALILRKMSRRREAEKAELRARAIQRQSLTAPGRYVADVNDIVRR